jgi:hypothetical protein
MELGQEGFVHFSNLPVISALMWIRIRAVIIEDEPLAAQYLAALLDDTCHVEVVGSAAESEVGLRLCAELRPDAHERLGNLVRWPLQ